MRWVLLMVLYAVREAAGVVAYATDRGRAEPLAQSARWNGWSALNVIGTQEGFDRHGLVDKLRALRRFARRRAADSILVFVDAYDVILNHEPFHLERTFLASGKRTLLASELGCCTDKATALAYGTTCRRTWPFRSSGRMWLNSEVIIGYAKDIRRLLRLAWKEYLLHPDVWRAYTDQQLLCFLMSDGATIWTREAVGIDHESDTSFDFQNRAVIHFNGPPDSKQEQRHFPLWPSGG